MTASTVIRAQSAASHAFAVGDAALFVDEGIIERVTIATDVYPHPQSREAMRDIWDSFGERYEVKARLLAPIGPGPADLATPRGRGVQTADYGDGRMVYAPDPLVRRVVAVAPVMERFELREGAPLPSVTVSRDHMTKAQRKALTKIEDVLAEADRVDAQPGASRRGALGYHLRQEARKMIVALNTELVAVGDVVAQSRDLVETVNLAKGRGEEIEVKDGLVCNLSRDGLATLLSSGAIDQIDLAAGMAYRKVFEAAQALGRMTAAYAESGGASARDPDRERLMRLRRLEKDQALTELERHVAARVRSPWAITTLRLVAGEGRPVSHISKGSGRLRRTEALRAALDVLAVRWGLK
jgi:hypothetical protein